MDRYRRFVVDGTPVVTGYAAHAQREGRARTPDSSLTSRLAAAAPYDADLFRALLEIYTCLALPQEVFQRTRGGPARLFDSLCLFRVSCSFRETPWS